MTQLNRILVILPAMAVLILVGFWFTIFPDALVVYCAHDAVYSQEILNEFTRQTNIPVQVRFDTEATKSLGLINLIVQERHQPRCDVFWNNELLGMVDLQQQGLLEPYQGSGWKRIPERYRDAEGYWVGFAARLRVYLWHGERSSLDDDVVQSLLKNEPEKLVIAKPLFGTTLTHFTVLWHLWGEERLKAWFNDLRSRGLRIVDGNSAVKDVVVMGVCQLGMTDTDDAFVALDERQPVKMFPIRVTADTVLCSASQAVNEASNDAPKDTDKRYTICIPNTVGIIKGTRRRSSAERLVDFLASAETELALAKAKSRQVPLGPIDQTGLPEELRSLTEWAADGIDLRPLLADRRSCLKWLFAEYLK